MRVLNLEPMGTGGGVVEADETFIGFLEGQPKKGRNAWSNKNVVFTLVERGGSARSFHVDGVRIRDLQAIMEQNLSPETNLGTDEMTSYKYLGKEYASHETVVYSKDEYVHGDVHTNTVEGYYSIFKRGMKGVYQHCKEKHLHRYLSEFDFRYSNRIALGVDDVARSDRALKGIVGKRLTYRATPE